MKTMIRLMTVAAGLMFAQMAIAQAAPAGSTGVCRDGSYTTAPTKKGACKGHKGVKTWLAADTSAAAPAKAASAAKSAAPTPPAAGPSAATPAPVKSSATHAARTQVAQAPGGGPGMVWVNSSSNVYHCPGSQFYGKTKSGSYMTEAEAKAKGAHADHNHPCSK
ncbi:hypothetical protein GCM10011507_32100 [Edaphobacter acidisoli]|uniref:DUF3761 domain-containing protein n=1 Tax=Edaphobacter acidisoli TaxID=2040573 RepID=A0A916S0V6_9BACT|nr:DUF3761 domain-containing protein [Edaphobacter acidisoli]GGA78454.1 hypothetical protein GCM10011507_32100 [Edaphobacter acidisoli]